MTIRFRFSNRGGRQQRARGEAPHRRRAARALSSIFITPKAWAIFFFNALSTTSSFSIWSIVLILKTSLLANGLRAFRLSWKSLIWRIFDQLNPGDLEPWVPGRLEPKSPRALKPSRLRALEPWSPWAGGLKASSPEALESWSLQGFEPLNPGILDLEPWPGSH